MALTLTRRPRNVDSTRAAGFLYGDWGTSKAYAIGLAFAISGYASFWLILAISLLSLLIGFNYILICKYFPNGGGVYASVRHRSEILSLLGAFFLIADYVVTASLSALSAFHYLGAPDPVLYAVLGIFAIGLLNYFGPKHSGEWAFIVGICTVVLLFILALFSVPFIPEALRNLKPLKGSFWHIWSDFIGIIVALSGIEAIANITGIMKLDPGSSHKNPSVKKTARRAIVAVMIEVALLTAFFSLALTSISGLTANPDAVITSEGINIRDSVLKFLGIHFVGYFLGPIAGKVFGTVLSIVIGILLLSAVNTSINALISLQYMMSKDGELPLPFQKLNRYGVPLLPYLIAILMPIALVLGVHDIGGLADLYAIGFVGAIATNLGSTSTDKTLPLNFRERTLMFFSALILLAVECTLFIDKPHARNYVLAIAFFGLLLRGLSREAKEKKGVAPLIENVTTSSSNPAPTTPSPKQENAILCVASKPSRALSFALERAERKQCPLYCLFVRQQGVISDQDLLRKWEDDPEAVHLFMDLNGRNAKDLPITCFYTVTDAPSQTISHYASRLNVSLLVMSFPRRARFLPLIRRNLVEEILENLSNEVQFLVIP